MRIEDAIKRYELWAEDDRIDVLIRKEHRQMADWLKELKVNRPQGEWIIHKERTEVNDGFIDFFPTEYECSNCGLKQSIYFIDSKPSNFCPNCGANMRGKE